MSIFERNEGERQGYGGGSVADGGNSLCKGLEVGPPFACYFFNTVSPMWLEQNELREGGRKGGREGREGAGGEAGRAGLLGCWKRGFYPGRWRVIGQGGQNLVSICDRPHHALLCPL